MRRDPLLFCHIPKTAGTSVRRALRQAFPDMVTVYGGELRLGAPDAQWIAELRSRTPSPALLYGHFSFGVHRFLDVPPRYAAFLRHPVDRIVSLYRHHAADTEATFHRRIRDGMTLAEFVASHDTEENNNHMCRVIGGILPQPGVRVEDPAVVDAAVVNLREHFVFVGLVESFAQSMDALARLVGAPLARDTRLNVATHPAPAIAPSDLRAIERENALDLALYERARSLVAAS